MTTSFSISAAGQLRDHLLMTGPEHFDVKYWMTMDSGSPNGQHHYSWRTEALDTFFAEKPETWTACFIGHCDILDILASEAIGSCANLVSLAGWIHVRYGDWNMSLRYWQLRKDGFDDRKAQWTCAIELLELKIKEAEAHEGSQVHTA